MRVHDILTFAAERLAEECVQFTPEDIVVVAVPLPDPEVGLMRVQIYDNGSSTQFEGGGNLGRRLSIGVRVYQKLVTDKFANLQRAGLNLQATARNIVKALHLRYDVDDVPLQEPIIFDSVGPVRLVTEGETRSLYIDLSFRCLFVMTALEVAEFET